MGGQKCLAPRVFTRGVFRVGVKRSFITTLGVIGLSLSLVPNSFAGRVDASVLKGSDYQNLYRAENQREFTSPISFSLERAKEFIIQIGKITGARNLFQNAVHQLKIMRKTRNRQVETTKFQHYYEGLEVVGSMFLHHQSANRQQGSDLTAQFDLDPHPEISSDTALRLVSARYPEREVEGVPQLKVLPNPGKTSARLVYWLEVASDSSHSGSTVLIDAHSGEFIADVPEHIQIGINIYSAERAPSTYNNGEGRPIKMNLKAYHHVIKDGKITKKVDSSGYRAYKNTLQALRYFYQRHERLSFDDQGTEVSAVVHAGRDWPNALWSPKLKLIVYGDGDGEILGDMTRALDVAGHEMTHAVISESIQSGMTKGLVHFGEPGALGEALADYFGKMIENQNSWAIGSNLFLRENDQKRGIRNLADPSGNFVVKTQKDHSESLVPHPSHVEEKIIEATTCTTENDQCWIHANSTIPSHAMYLTHQKIGGDRAEKLFYTVLTQYLTPTSDFQRFRDASIQACEILYSDETCSDVSEAFAQVGLVTQEGSLSQTHLD